MYTTFTHVPISLCRNFLQQQQKNNRNEKIDKIDTLIGHDAMRNLNLN